MSVLIDSMLAPGTWTDDRDQKSCTRNAGAMQDRPATHRELGDVHQTMLLPAEVDEGAVCLHAFLHRTTTPAMRALNGEESCAAAHHDGSSTIAVCRA